MRGFDEHFAEHVLQLTNWLKLAPQEAAPTISRRASADFLDDWRWISPFVIPSVLWSLYSFLRTPEDYWETVCTAILAGGDVDATAAMAGAISGAHVGLKRLPVDLAAAGERPRAVGLWGASRSVEPLPPHQERGHSATDVVSFAAGVQQRPRPRFPCEQKPLLDPKP